MAALPVAAIILLGSTALFWFRGDYTAVAGYDFAVSLNPWDDLRRSLYLWDDRLYAGTPNFLSVGAMPYFLLQYILESAAGSLYRGQMLLFVLIFTLPGLTMLYFLRTAFRGDAKAGQVSFLGALLYMLNAFVVIRWNRGELITLFAYGMLPLMLAICERVLSRGLDLRYMPLAICAFFFFPVSAGHPADFLISAGVITAYALWRLHHYGRGAALRLGALAMLSTGLSLWWLVPLLMASGAGGPVGSFEGGLGLVDYYSSWTTFLKLFKMWSFSMYATSIEFNTQFYRPGSLVFPLIAFAALLFRRNGLVLFFSFAALVALWLSKGTAEPFPAIYRWLYAHIPYFFVFRAPSRCFPLIYTLAVSVLAAYTAASAAFLLKTRYKGRRFNLAPALCITALTLFNSWPLFSRDAIFRTAAGDLLYPSVFVDIPDYYRGLDAWLKARGALDRVHSFSTEPYLNYDWGYSSTDLMPKLVEAPQTLRFSQELLLGSSGFHALMNGFTSSFWSGSFEGAGRFLGLFGVRHIVLVDDVMRRYLPHVNYIEILERELGENQDGVRLAASIGKALVYENDWALPMAFATEDATVMAGDAGLIRDAVATGAYVLPLFISRGDGHAEVGVSECLAEAATVDACGSLPRSIVVRSVRGKANFELPPGRYEAFFQPVRRGVEREAVFEAGAASNEMGRWLMDGGHEGRPDGVLLRAPGGLLSAVTWIESPFDMEEYPYISVDGRWVGEAGSLWVVAGVDTDNDGWADDELEAEARAGSRTDLSALIKRQYGFPGKRSYRPVWAGVRVGNGAFLLSGLSVYREIPARKAITHERLMIDGKAARGGRATLAGGAHRMSGDFVAVIRPLRKAQGAPAVELTKVSPVSYIARVSGGGRGPFWLVLNESFHQGWQAFDEGGGIALRGHRMANGYANAWLVDATEGDIEIKIEFRPQKALYGGAIASGGSALAALGLCAVRKRGGRGDAA